ncbi:MAG: T9SS type A sorting domain-containing protein [Candidatus Eisenbacteria bacterium]|uniref:Aminopeptidase N n=1 Tax=Eiseniibacteriota bacterium TaxID=2212470 RepID=A0A948RYV0_UNCEI|nr:T9SS type A sorting domain-containing protein [Candidatus Eisenbacteria bacterium]MBU1951105.1 T9SS type A sorting domain-containing protein [Candidatus Eisenbacteria bacterium]MBU2692491.1 T9SS type A sorting domain-containing protein [Candidatus Eisenbacteria bacterium]
MRKKGQPLAIILPLIIFLTLITGASAGSVEDADFPISSQMGDSRIGPDAPPILLPPTAAGWQGEVRSPWDVASYLAFHKAAAFDAGTGSGSREIPTGNQYLYDVGYYDIVFNLNPSTHVLTGTVTMRATASTASLDMVELDLRVNMNVSSVTSGGAATTYSHLSDILSIDLDRTYSSGEEFILVIDYSGTPSGGYFAFDSNGGETLIWTLSQPYGARTWWPCKDYPFDKPDSVDIHVTVPSGLITASNGSLREQTDDGTLAYSWWHEEYPIATYLVSLAIHPYSVFTDAYVYSPGDSMDLVFYDFPAHAAGNRPINAMIKDIIGAFASVYNEYPFLNEKYGHAEFPWGGGMEHQTCTSLGYYAESIAAHELSHMWWGDMITCEDYHHIWLNEGMATYSEAIWYELAYGPEAYHQDLSANQYFGPGTIYVPDLSNTNRIFDSNLSYNKGSWVPHMLRHVVGDDDFFEILNTYYTQYGYSVATTEDFQSVAESVSGLELGAFFTQWIYGEYFPIYSYSWNAAASGDGFDISLIVDQLQSSQIFTMPIDVAITTASGEEIQVIQDHLATQSFMLHVDEEPLSIVLDPDNWILRLILSPLPEPTFDKEILLVNGVSWDSYGAEILSAYEDRAFSGDLAIDFWDYFDEPGSGYPSTLPAPRGHGAVPGDILGEYKNVIWIGNDYNGDVSGWIDSPIYSYLGAGGNVLLMTRRGESFIMDPYREYLGIDWESETTIYDCIAVEPGLSDIARIGTQSYNATFSSTVGPESTLLFEAQQGFGAYRGIGVIAIPPDGGTYNPEGGRFAFLSGRPYRWDHFDLQENVIYILYHYFGIEASDVGQSESSNLSFILNHPGPNPFSALTSIGFTLPTAESTRLAVWDISGRLVRVLLDNKMDAGRHSVKWDGLDGSGNEVATGLYFYRLESGTHSAQQKVLKLK